MFEGENVKKFLQSLTVFFAVLLAIVFVVQLVKPDATFSNAENRLLATKPKLSADTLLSGKYEKDMQQYVNDQFPGRTVFMKIKSAINVALGNRESQGVVLAADDYLMETFQKYSDTEENEKMTAMETFQKKYKKIKQHVMIVPTAIDILEDKVPEGIPMDDQDSAIIQFESWSQTRHFDIVDCRELLRQHKEEKIYYQTDHHWTSDGVYLAFCEALAPKLSIDATKVKYDKVCVKNNFKGSLIYKSGSLEDKQEELNVYLPKDLQAQSIVNYVEEGEKTATMFNHEKLETNSPYEVFLNGNHSLIKIQTAVKNEKVLLIFKDSYANCMIPFIAPYYSEIVVVDPRYYYDDINELIEAEEVTEILYLYNANTFFQDTSLTSVLTE